MRQYRDTTGFTDGSRSIGEIHVAGNRLRHPQRQDVAGPAADLNAGHNVKGVKMASFIGPQAAAERIVIGNRDDIKLGAMPGDKIQQLGDSRLPVTGGRVHVQIGAAGEHTMVHEHNLFSYIEYVVIA